MDTTSVISLVNTVWNLVVPYAEKIGGELAEKAGQALPGLAHKLWNLIKEKMEAREDLDKLPTDLMQHPDDQIIQAAFQYQLKRLIENDEAFAQQLQALVLMHQTKPASISHSENIGDGAIAQGKKSKAVGKKGVIVEGKVIGDIVTGNKSNDGSKK